MAVNREFIAQRMRYLFRRTKEQGLAKTLSNFIVVPLLFIRDYTCPMAEKEAWNRNRASIVPLTMPITFFYLTGKFKLFTQDEDVARENEFWLDMALLLLMPATLLALFIRFRTKKTQAPPLLLNIYAAFSFVMSIAWISFTCDCIMDLLQLMGFITRLPSSLLALTILAWGNCLGDLSADVAMTKKGFGEMALTGTLAGPIFNILVAQGLSMLLKLFASDSPFESYIRFSVYKLGAKPNEQVFDE